MAVSDFFRRNGRKITIKVGQGDFESLVTIQVAKPQENSDLYRITFAGNTIKIDSCVFSLNDSDQKIARTFLRECASQCKAEDFFNTHENKRVYAAGKCIGVIKPDKFPKAKFFECLREVDFFHDELYFYGRKKASIRLMRYNLEEKTPIKVWSDYPVLDNRYSGVWVDFHGDADDLIKKSDRDFLRTALHPVIQENKTSFEKGQVFYDEDGVRFSVTNSQLELESLRNPHRMAFWSGAAASVIGGALIALAVTGFVGSTFGIGGIALAALGLIVMIMAQVDKTCFKMELFEGFKRTFDNVFNFVDTKPVPTTV